MRKPFIFLFIYMFCVGGMSHAQTFNYFLTGNPVNTTGWTLSSQSYVSNDEVVLTDPQQTQAGYIYYDTAQNLANCSQFTVSFDFKITNSSFPTADGISFWYISNPPTGFINGGGLGLPDYPDGLVLLLDTYNNNGFPDDNPLVSLRQYDGTTYQYVEGSTTGRLAPDVTTQSFITDGSWHTCTLVYNFGTITVSFDNNPPIMTGTTLYPLNFNGYFGFSASTGALWSKQAIKNVSISGSPNPNPPVTDSVFYCKGSPAVPLTATAPSGGNLAWYASATGGSALPSAPTPNTNTPGTYIWYVSEIVPGCNLESTRAPLVVTVEPLPQYNRYDSICPGLTYTFYGRTLTQSGIYDTIIPNPDPDVCDSLIILHLVKNTFANVVLDPDSVLSFCKGNQNAISVVDPTPGAEYDWMRSGATIGGQHDTQLFVTHPGDYQVIGILNGCPDTSSVVHVSIYPSPDARILPQNPEPFCALDTLTLQVASPKDYDYRWSPGNAFRRSGGSAEGPEVKGVFTQPQTEVVLTAVNQYSCFAYDTISVLTYPCCDVFLPNAFSPNGDGVNDYFEPQFQVGQHVLSFTIYNRYGQKVFESKSEHPRWDGTLMNGSPSDIGMYMYYIRYTCANGKIFQRKGEINLLR